MWSIRSCGQTNSWIRIPLLYNPNQPQPITSPNREPEPTPRPDPTASHSTNNAQPSPGGRQRRVTGQVFPSLGKSFVRDSQTRPYVVGLPNVIHSQDCATTNGCHPREPTRNRDRSKIESDLESNQISTLHGWIAISSKDSPAALRASSRFMSIASAKASWRFEISSSRVSPWQLTPGISSIQPIHHGPS